MSAWMVSDAHIDLLATAWVQLIDPAADPQEIGQQLAHDCAASIRARYPSDTEAREQAFAYRFRRWPGNIDPEFLAKQHRLAEDHHRRRQDRLQATLNGPVV